MGSWQTSRENFMRNCLKKVGRYVLEKSVAELLNESLKKCLEKPQKKLQKKVLKEFFKISINIFLELPGGFNEWIWDTSGLILGKVSYTISEWS